MRALGTLSCGRAPAEARSIAAAEPGRKRLHKGRYRTAKKEAPSRVANLGGGGLWIILDPDFSGELIDNYLWSYHHDF